jgi:hypothetical protein
MRLTIVAAALAAASLLSAFPPAIAADLELGVDVTYAGKTHAEVRNFLTTLEPEARRSVIDGCHHFLQEPAQVQEHTISFCKLVL